MKEKIIEGAEALFIQYGVRSVSMDDVARAVSISKKTIYQHFSNKDELVAEAAKSHLEKDRERLLKVIDQAGNAIEELFMLSKCLRENVLKINPSLLYDLQKYHYKAWNIYKKYKDEFIRGQVIENINRGKKEGYYRPELDARILSIVRVEMVQVIFDERIFPTSDFELPEVHVQVFDHFIHGLLTEEGRQLYQTYLSKEAKPTLK